MLPEHLDLQNVTFYVKGQKIGTGVSTLFADVETTPVEGPIAIGKYEGSIELKDCEFHPEWFALTGQPCDITVSKLAPYRKPRSKKKRLRKKFAKKYTISQVTYHDCTITNFGEEK